MLNLDAKLYRSEITKHSAKCLKQLKRGVATTVPVPSSKAPINALFGWNYIFDWSLFLVLKITNMRPDVHSNIVLWRKEKVTVY